MKIRIAALAILASTSLPATADTLLLDAINAAPTNSQSGVQRPARGSSMANVSAQFGEPSSTKAAVGEPPISRWIYPAYTVYFEHDRVIDVVIHR
ncbi:MAG: hypothetical protein QNJ91_12945 [Gammaproteobacteria bacterium]|nr:hypothetical protein [Gammaproteobacteria bacterium]